MEWIPARIRLLRAAGLCLSQDKFATALGLAKRTVGNAERGAHPPSLALRRALDQALENASDAQRDRFFAALAAEQTAAQVTPASRNRGHRLAPTLDGLRGAVLGWPLTLRRDMSAHSAQGWQRRQRARWRPPWPPPRRSIVSTNWPTTTHMTAAAYIAAAKLATKLSDSDLAWVTADRAITAANENDSTGN